MNKLARAAEIATMLTRHAPDLRSRLALLSCYASTLKDTTSSAEVALRLRIQTTVFPFRMRKSDVFVLDEILLERQYTMRSRLGPRPVIIDAGANIGVAGLWFLGHHPDATLHCFEPHPANVRLLGENLGSMDNVRIEPRALGAQTSPITLHLAEHHAMHSLVDQGFRGGSMEVACCRLADYVQQRGIARIDLLKLDVEGNELEVLRGAGDSLEAVRVIVGEVHEVLVDATALYSFMHERGFRTVQKRYMRSSQQDRTHMFEAAR